jgi:hypothetical protein
LEYADVIWDSQNQRLINKLENVQLWLSTFWSSVQLNTFLFQTKRKVDINELQIFPMFSRRQQTVDIPVDTYVLLFSPTYFFIPTRLLKKNVPFYM